MLLSILLGVSLGLALTNLDHSLGTLLGWLFTLGWSALYQRTKGQNWKGAFIAGIVTLLLSCPWLLEVIRSYFGIQSWLAYLAYVLVVVLLALQWVFAHFLFHALGKFSFLSSPLRLSLSWLAAENLFFQLFPWSVANTQSAFVFFIQVADVGGTSFVSFLMFLISGFMVQALSSFSARDNTPYHSPTFSFILACLLFTLTLFYGKHTLDGLKTRVDNAEKLHIGLIQPDFDPTTHFQKTSVYSDLKNLRNLTHKALFNTKLDLIVWPESSVVFNYWLHEKSVARNSPRDPFPYLQIPLLFGGQVRRGNESIQGKLLYHNAALLLTPLGFLDEKYFKQRLFPFSEQIPFADHFPSLLKLSPDSSLFVEGEAQEPLELQVIHNGKKVTRHIAVNICYEDMTSESYHSIFNNSPADLLIAITNDSWFPDLLSHRQHHVIASFRAIEFRRAFLRVGVDGITGLIDPSGSTTTMIPALEAGYVNVEAPVLTGDTLYMNWGAKLISLISWMILLIALVCYLFKRASRVQN